MARIATAKPAKDRDLHEGLTPKGQLHGNAIERTDAMSRFLSGTTLLDPAAQKRSSYPSDPGSLMTVALISAVLACTWACNESRSPTEPTTEECGGYANWQTSDYILPYPVGTAFQIVQGNCSSPNSNAWNSHQSPGPWMYAYDFLLPIGTPIVAVLGGIVHWAHDAYPEGGSGNNSIVIEHFDGTYAGYGHLTFGGALVEIGEQVAQGERIGTSGSSGDTDTPHLHLHVSPCPDVDEGACRSLPMTFRNTRPNPSGLILGEFYESLPF